MLSVLGIASIAVCFMLVSNSIMQAHKLVTLWQGQFDDDQIQHGNQSKAGHSADRAALDAHIGVAEFALVSQKP